MKVLLDTNIILDVMLKRPKWFKDSFAIWQAHEKSQLTGCVSASSITDIFYVTTRLTNEATAREVVRLCLNRLDVLPITKATLLLADSLEGNDFEDNVQIACVKENKIPAIVTRDKVGFRSAGVSIYTPKQLLTMLRRN